MNPRRSPSSVRTLGIVQPQSVSEISAPPVPVLVAHQGHESFDSQNHLARTADAKQTTEIHSQKKKTSQTKHLARPAGRTRKPTEGQGAKRNTTLQKRRCRFTNSCRQSDAQFCHRVDSQNQAVLSEPMKGSHPKAACPLPPPVGRLPRGSSRLPGTPWCISGSQPVPRDVFGHGIRGPITASRSAVSQPVHRDVFGHGIRGPITAAVLYPSLVTSSATAFRVRQPHSRGFRSH